MKLSEEYARGCNVIHSYQEGKININGKNCTHSLVVSNHTLNNDWAIQDIKQLDKYQLDFLLIDQPEVIIIGTGQQLVFPHPEQYAHLIQRGIGVEFMDTGAACRTYNILLSEDRRVVAGLII